MSLFTLYTRHIDEDWLKLYCKPRGLNQKRAKGLHQALALDHICNIYSVFLKL